MNFETAGISFHTHLSGMFRLNINTKKPLLMSLSGVSRYTELKLDAEETRIVNTLAMEGLGHESGPTSNSTMVYNTYFHPGKVVEDSSEATAEERRVFSQIFETAALSIARQMELSVSSADVKRIVIDKSVVFSSFGEPPQRACTLDIELSESAADKLGIKQDPRFRDHGYGTDNFSDSGLRGVEVHPGQF